MAKLPFEIDPQETALLVVDMQNDFCYREGRPNQPGGSMNRVIPYVKRLATMCRQAGIPILWSRQVHFPNDITRRKRKIPSHLEKLNFYPCMFGTPGAEIIDELKEDITSNEHIFEKHRSSCFYETTLEAKLRMLGITMPIIAGVASGYCVESTIRDAYARDYEILVVKECIGSSSEEADRITLENVDKYFGLTLPLDELAASLPIPQTAHS